MKTRNPIRRRTRLDAVIALVYEYRHEIAYGLMVASVMLRSWSPILDLVPTVKPAKARVVKTRSSQKK